MEELVVVKHSESLSTADSYNTVLCNTVQCGNVSFSLLTYFSAVAINGYLFGNLPGLEMCANKKVSWHMFGMGNEVDIHSAYFHGHTVLDRGHRSDVISLFPATFVTSEMITENVGKWMLSCQVNDHIQGTQWQCSY